MPTPALIFDLDGTLVDSVYQHVLAWHEALQEAGVELAVWRIHRRIGMSGGLLTRALLRETGRETNGSARQPAGLHLLGAQVMLSAIHNTFFALRDHVQQARIPDQDR